MWRSLPFGKSFFLVVLSIQLFVPSWLRPHAQGVLACFGTDGFTGGGEVIDCLEGLEERC